MAAEFSENLVDDEIPEHGDSHASSSHEASLEPIFKRREDLCKHSVYTHFSKDRNCEICQRTKITRAPCRRRNGGAVLRAENFGVLITADHKVLSDNCESRNNHRYAVVVQDLATQWNQAYPTNLDVKQEKRIDDYWNVDGSRDLSDLWTGFTQFTLLEEKPPEGYVWSGERLTGKQQTSRPDHLWPEFWKTMGKNAKLKEKQKWSNEKLHLENARKLRGIYFIDPEDKGFKETIKNARRKLETPMAPIKLKQELRVFWKLVNQQDCVWENHCQIIMRIILRERVTIHCNIIIWFTNLFPCLKL